MKEKIFRFFRQIRGLFPSALPQGVAEFDQWVTSLVSTYNFPTSDLDSIKFTLATVIMHLGTKEAYKSNIYFVLVFKAAVAKQVAGNAFYEIKMKQQSQQSQAQTPAPTKQAAAPALQVVPNGPQGTEKSPA